MWTRRELKEKAKFSFKANYWKAVLVAFIAIAIGGGLGGAGTAATSIPSNLTVTPHVQTTSYDSDYYYDYGDELDDIPNFDGEWTDEEVNELVHEVQHETSSPAFVAGAGLALMLIILIALVAIAVAIVIDAFIINPLEVGSKRFFLRNLNQTAEVKEIAYAFDNNYMEIVKTVLLRDVFIALWSLLFIIPGIIKSYEYRMIPYLMADDPTLTRTQAFEMSKNMMHGNKWKAFVLDLSFLGWNILSLLTLGILGIFYVYPYEFMTDAALYEALRYGTPAPGFAAASAYAEQVPVPPFAAEESFAPENPEA